MTTDEQAIRALVARWHAATAAGDVETVLTLMSDDVVFIGVGRPPMKGRAQFEEGLRKLLDGHRVESTGDVRDIGVSGDLAYCWTDLTVRITPRAGGDSKLRRGSTRSILCRQDDGSWMMTRDANMLPPAG